MGSQGYPRAEAHIGPGPKESRVTVKVGERIPAAVHGCLLHPFPLVWLSSVHVSAPFCCSINWKISSVLPDPVLREEVWLVQAKTIVYGKSFSRRRTWKAQAYGWMTLIQAVVTPGQRRAQWVILVRREIEHGRQISWNVQQLSMGIIWIFRWINS